MMIRFIHTADIHFGMENYGRIDAASGIHSRLLDFEKALMFCIDYAIEQDVDFFLFSGDAYKTANPSPTHQRLLLNCLLRLHKANIPMVLIVGNHDNPLSFGKAHALDIYGQLPLNGFHVVSKPQIVRLQTKSGPCNIVGMPWPTRNSISLSDAQLNVPAHLITQYISQACVKIIQNLAAELDANEPAVLAGHLTVSNGVFSGSEKRAVYGTDPLFLPSQLAITPFDYVALGHLHRYQNLNPNGHPAIIYAGSPERVDFGERKEDKGFCDVIIHDKIQTTHTFIKTPVRPFIQIDVQLNELESQTDQILKAIAQHEIQNAVLKIVYYVPAGVKDRVDGVHIQQACVRAWYLVGIFPVRALAEKVHRPALKVDMNMEKLLDSYFTSHPYYKQSKERLITKALQLLDEHQTKTTENEQ